MKKNISRIHVAGNWWGKTWVLFSKGAKLRKESLKKEKEKTKRGTTRTYEKGKKIK